MVFIMAYFKSEFECYLSCETLVKEPISFSGENVKSSLISVSFCPTAKAQKAPSSLALPPHHKPAYFFRLMHQTQFKIFIRINHVSGSYHFKLYFNIWYSHLQRKLCRKLLTSPWLKRSSLNKTQKITLFMYYRSTGFTLSHL